MVRGGQLCGHVTPLQLGASTNVADTDDVRAQEEGSGQVIQLVMGVDVRLVSQSQYRSMECGVHDCLPPWRSSAAASSSRLACENGKSASLNLTERGVRSRSKLATPKFTHPRVFSPHFHSACP